MVVGWKITVIVQLVPGLNRTPAQVFVWVNGPLAATFVMLKIPGPALASVTVSAWLLVKTTWVGNVRLVGEKVTAGSTPTPVNGSDCGLLGALSVMPTAAVRVPEAEGLNVTVML